MTSRSDFPRASSPRISAVDAEPIFGTLRPEIALISALGSQVNGSHVLVRIRSDDGLEGIGEGTVTAVWSGETQAGALALIREVFAPLLVDADPFDLEWIMARLDRAAWANSFAKAAVEMALLDLQGKALGVPVYQLLGGRDPERADVRLKFVVGAVEPALAAERAAAMVERGWRAIKVKVGRPSPADDVLRLREVRRAIGPDVWLSVDANGGYAAADAIRVARLLEPLDVRLFEQPVPRGQLPALAAVRRRSGIPVMADESVFTPEDVLAVIRAEAADVVSLYPGKHGGVRITQALARMALAAGIPCTIGSNLEREVATAAMAHVVAATPNLQCEHYPGDLIGPVYYQEPLGGRPLDYRADRLAVPTGPGLGVVVGRS